MRELSAAESDRRAAAGEPFVLRFRVPREHAANVCFRDAVYGEQIKSAADIEDFALLRSNGMPTYHPVSYTHLDVYKRQTCDSDRRCAPAMCA